ncbi:hypothetical protein LCGC14_2612620 [marine sediment metagenome]|uniref:Uncharacterized protein n=1 Tax=marine sediment metagenome TaxID=412755 RepID=A0A0F9CY51_9ZZZZ
MLDLAEDLPRPEAIEGFIGGSYFLLSYSPKIEELLCVWPSHAPALEGNFKPFSFKQWQMLKAMMEGVDYAPYNGEFETESQRAAEAAAKEGNKNESD